LTCCEDCRQLAAFLIDPRQVTHNFKVVTNRRKHIERTVQSYTPFCAVAAALFKEQVNEFAKRAVHVVLLAPVQASP
jgi:hypothetical protein